MKIDAITINNYKSIKEIENLKLTNLNILIGSNSYNLAPKEKYPHFDAWIHCIEVKCG